MAWDGRVLIVDDSPLILKLLKRKLERSGFQVSTASSGAEAFKLATDQDAAFDLMILDILMEGLDGCELARRLRAHPKTHSASILMLTSLGPESLSLGLKAGADDFLSKSASDEELAARVRSLISLGRLRDRSSHAAGTISKMLAEDAPAAESSEAEPSAEPMTVILLHGVEDARASLAARLAERKIVPILCDSVEAVMNAMSRRSFDVIVSSRPFALEGEGALLPFLQLRQWPPAVLVLDAALSAEHRLAAFAHGADAYIPEDVGADELGTRIANIIRRRMRYHALELARDRAVRAAISDPLTGIYNRGYFEETLRMEMLRSHRRGGYVALLLVDLDHFKGVNDRHGHLAGDAVLRATSSVLTRNARAVDIVARYGGEEFAVVLPDSHVEGGRIVADRLSVALGAESIPISETLNITVTASIGVADSRGCDAPRDLVERADMALYQAKKQGRNRVVVATRDDAARRDGLPSPSVPKSEPGPARALLERIRGTPDGPLLRIRKAAAKLSWSASELDPPLGKEIQEAASAIEALLEEHAQRPGS